jgi:hypothetical protein
MTAVAKAKLTFRCEPVPPELLPTGSNRTWRVVTGGPEAPIVTGRFTKEVAEAEAAKLNACPECGRAAVTRRYPSHDGSRMCEQGSIASGGSVAHCGCACCYGGTL